MGAFLALGAGWLIQGPSQALRDLLGDPWIILWSAIVAIGGLCGLVASLSAHRDEGLSLLTERIALWSIGTYSAVYVIAMLYQRGLSIWVTEAVFTFFVIACVWRLVQVQKRITWNKKVGRDARLRWAR